MLRSEVFLQAFPPVDLVTKVPMFLSNFELTRPGYNDEARGERVLYFGKTPRIERGFEAIERFLDAMPFASNADRTNAVAAGLIVLLRNHWLGAKPMILVTSTKSHAGKDTIIDFATGRTPPLRISYEDKDWAFQKNFAQGVESNPDTGVVVVENVRLGQSHSFIASAFLERFLTDRKPILHSTGTGSPKPRKNDLVIAMSTNFGCVSEDLMNRSLPIHLNPTGDIVDRESPIGNPRLEYLPANREQIEAELRGMIVRWVEARRPLDERVRHPFLQCAQAIGGILQVSGFEDFLGNYSHRRTIDDPIRQALGVLGATASDEWLRPIEWVRRCIHEGVDKTLLAAADRGADAAMERGIGKVLSAHVQETFQYDTDDVQLTLRLEKARCRFDGMAPHVRYRFVVLVQEPMPEDTDQ